MQLRRRRRLQPRCWLLLLLPLMLGCQGVLCSLQLPAQICHVCPHLLQVVLLGHQGSLGLLQQGGNSGTG